MLKLIFYVPESHLEATKAAVFEAGGGGIGDYEHCAWQVLGTGQFKPLRGADPYIGEVGMLEKVEEWRVEIIVPEDNAANVARALKDSHPYEEPAFEFIQMMDVQF
ncbi:YqfO family protein [Acinetobacter indicus]|uniref:NGG1p interacting factor NIF3 n=1 Tax=Acinetobacter indicus TaxID=756892 RepID=UPI0012E1BAAD|nr:NGG1p interacting factor NIF3 [Acinetobacter indicus]